MPRYFPTNRDHSATNFFPQGHKLPHTKRPPLRGATGGKHRNKPPNLLISRHYFAPLTLNPYTLNPFPSHRIPPKKHRISNNHSTIQRFNHSTIQQFNQSTSQPFPPTITLNPSPSHRIPPKKHRISNNHSTIKRFNDYYNTRLANLKNTTVIFFENVCFNS